MKKKVENVPAESVINIDFNSPDVPRNVRLLKPVVYMDGDAYCCLLGDDPESGVFGCGETPKEAMEDWDRHYKEMTEYGKSSQQE